MNLIDFRVKEIIEERTALIWVLMGMSEKELNKEFERDLAYYNWLCSRGVYQEYRYVDEGGECVRKHIVREGQGYYVGYVGQH